MRRLLPLLALLLLAIAPGAAQAHGGATVAVDYRSEVTGTPDGVDAVVVGGDDRLAVTRDGADEVIVLGYEGEPYLRLDADGIWENRRSPAVGINAERGEGVAAAGADASAEPDWQRIGGGDTVLFHDHRAHWMGSQPPAAVRDDPGTARRLADWEVPLLVDGTPGAIIGWYGWEPAPATNLWLLVLGGLALGLSVLVCVLSDARRRLALRILAAVAILPAPILAVGEVLDLPSPGGDLAVGLVVYAVILIALLAALRWARRDPAAEAALLALGALALGAFAYIGRLDLIQHAVVPSALSATTARVLLVVGAAATIAVAVGAVATWRATLAATGSPKARRPPTPREEAW